MGKNGILDKKTPRKKKTLTTSAKPSLKKIIADKSYSGTKPLVLEIVTGTKVNKKSGDQVKNFVPSELTKNKNVQSRYFFTKELPASYNQTYFRAVVRDPETLFCYWEIAPRDLEREKKRCGEHMFNSSKKILRVFDVTDSHTAITPDTNHFDIEIFGFNDSHYIPMAQPGKKYVLQFGILFPDRSFSVLAQSNEVVTPPNKVSDIIDEHWFTPSSDQLISLSEKHFFTVPASQRPEKFPNSAERKEIPSFIGASDNAFVRS